MREAARIARRFATLVEMGFERADHAPVATDVIRLDPATAQVVGGRPAMGTLVSVSAVGESPDRLEEAIGRAFAEMDRLIGLLSRFEPASAVSQLNATGRLEGAPPEVVRVVRRALEHHALSGGAFDVTVAPLVDLFADRFGRDTPTEPTAAEIRDALERVGRGTSRSRGGGSASRARASPSRSTASPRATSWTGWRGRSTGAGSRAI